MPVIRLPSTIVGAYFSFLGCNLTMSALLEEYPLESRLVRRREPHKAIVAVSHLYLWRKYYNVTLVEFRLHRIAHNPHCERVGVVNVRAANIIVRDADRVIKVVKIGRISRGDLIDNRDKPAGRNRYFYNRPFQ